MREGVREENKPHHVAILDSEHMEAFGASKAARASDVLMMGLTLIQSAAAKGAATFFLLYILFFFPSFPFLLFFGPWFTLIVW